MNATDFFSSNSYVFLPKKNSPKVALAVDNSALAQNAFKLFNPFSEKAKVLKKVSTFVFTNLNGLSKLVFRIKQEEKSAFVSYLETKLGGPLVASLYFATIHDKVVIQLQTPTAEIVGYLKYPLNEIGLQQLVNEKKAIDILSDKKIVYKYLLHGAYIGNPFLLLSALEGEIGLVERRHIDDLLLKFKRKEVYLLINHPRIVRLKLDIAISFPNYLSIIEKVCCNSSKHYSLVYEHGDFTPWNIINVNGNYMPFDFEHFTEEGLEYFDLIKYYYQVGKLLKKMTCNEIISYIKKQITIPEIFGLLQLFLIKEILRCQHEDENFNIESDMLHILSRQ